MSASLTDACDLCPREISFLCAFCLSLQINRPVTDIHLILDGHEIMDRDVVKPVFFGKTIVMGPGSLKALSQEKNEWMDGWLSSTMITLREHVFLLHPSFVCFSFPFHTESALLQLVSDKDRVMPSFILSNHPQYFDQLFALLASEGEISQRVWTLITRLPTNQKLLARVCFVLLFLFCLHLWLCFLFILGLYLG